MIMIGHETIGMDSCCKSFCTFCKIFQKFFSISFIYKYIFTGIPSINNIIILKIKNINIYYLRCDPPSKAGLLTSVGVEEIQKLKNEIDLPIVAVGGINEKNVESVLNGGADGIAVISSIMQADNPEATARCLCTKILQFKASDQ